MGVSDDRPQREAAQVEPGAFAGDGAGEYRGHPDNWAKQGAAAVPNGGDPDGPAHAPVDKDAPYDMPSIPRAGATDADFAAGTTVERVVGHDEWRVLVPEMVAVCFEAAKRLLKPWEQILEPPLSADYVAERIVLAPSPPEGYVARERGERRRMQGFVLICDFCTFSKSLRWTSTHPAALAGTFDVLPHERVARRRAAWPPRNASAAEVADGAAGCHRSSMEARTLRKVDDSGAVARALEATGPCDTREPRDKEYGDAISVWPKLAEVAVLGALGCGRRLLDKALADCAANDRHAHAVLHATKDAVKFYEKVGFVRVGAVSRFRDRADVPQLAYRHWTRRVDEVSYMMARPLSAVDDAPPPPVSRRRLSRRHALELVHTCMYGDVMAPGGATAFRECLLLAIGYASEGGAPDRPLALALAAALSVFRADIPDKTLSILRAKVLPALSNESDDDDDGAGDDDALRPLPVWKLNHRDDAASMAWGVRNLISTQVLAPGAGRALARAAPAAGARGEAQGRRAPPVGLAGASSSYGRRELPLSRAAGHEPAARARARLPVEDEAPEALARVNEP